MSEQQLGTVVIGGSQAGLAVGYYLKQRGCRSSSWTRTSASVLPGGSGGFAASVYAGRYNGLPGMAFPGSPWAYPTKDETADYLEAYARAFELLSEPASGSTDWRRPGIDSK